jgi:hypothetical protein
VPTPPVSNAPYLRRRAVHAQAQQRAVMATPGVRFDTRRKCFVSRTRPTVTYRGLTRGLRALSLSARPRARGPAGVRAYGRRSAASIDRVITRAIETGSYSALRRGSEASAFFDALRAWKLRPLAAQVPVCLPAARLATAIDVIATDSRGRCVVLELKCGYEGVFERGPAASIRTGPLRGMQNTPLLYAWVQAAVGARLYARNAGLRAVKVAVVQLCRGEVALYPVPAEVRAKIPAVIRALRRV